MKTTDSQLQQMFVRATDEVIPPSPWLEAQVVDALHRRARARQRLIDWGRLAGFGSGLRLAAGLVALVLAVGTVAAVLMSARLQHNPTVPGGRSATVQTFTPSPAMRAANWPPGGPLPAQLAGGWRQNPSAQILHLGGYTFELGDVQPGPNICGHCAAGNVVVNGSEIDFMDDACTLKAGFGFERFTYTLTGNTLVLTRAEGPGQSACRWLLAGTYSRVSTP